MSQTLEDYLRKQYERNKKARLANPDKYRAYQREYYAKNKVMIAEKKREWRKRYIIRLKQEAENRKG